MASDVVEWLLEPPVGRLAGGFHLSDEAWTIDLEELRFGEDVILYVVSADIRHEISFEGRGRQRPALMMGSFASGALRMDTPDQRYDLVRGETIACRPLEMTARFHLQPVTGFRHIGLSFDGEMIARLFDDRLPDALRPFVDERQSRSIVEEISAPASLATLRRLAFAAPLTGTLRRLALEGASQAVMAELVAYRGADGRDRALTTREERLVREARARLLADLRNPPDLGMLAEELGLSRRRLILGLRCLYGSTAYDLVRDARLEHARVILAETDLPLKEIAWRVGYAHASNFIAAFTRRFGESPRRQSPKK